ncbi:MAG: hypothetical protein HQL16_02750 [Candidatus Omnitrophica bacterium]|nr:hypothetical protein [Candidatus Omnitrophota bacterium]
MRKTLIAVLFFLGLVLINIPVSVAEEAENDKFSFGKVVNVAAGQITVKEYDFTKDADVEMTYSVTSETELGNINAVTDLTANDDVVIDYVEKDGKRVVTTLVKEEKGAETPAASTAAEAPKAPEAAPAAAVAAPAAEAAPAAAAPAAEAAPAAAPAAVAPAAEAAPAAAPEAPAQK